jgi:hypothetical protein
MSKKILISAIILFSASFILISGCNKSDNVVTSTMTDDQYIQSVVSNGYSSNGGDEDNVMSTEATDLDTGLVSDNGSPMNPIDSLQKWGRRVSNVHLDFNIESQGDSVKVVHVTRTITGNYLILGWVNGQSELISKPYAEVFYRDISFKRIDTRPDPSRNWRLYKVSILSGGTTQPQIGNNFVSITKVEVYVNTSGTPTYIFNGPDFTQNVFTTIRFGGAGIPTLNRGDQVQIKVYTTSTNSSIDYVAWHWARNTFGFHRIPFTLESQTGSGPYYRIYSKSFNVYANHKLGVFNSYLSASTHESLYDDDVTKFASSELGTPYKVLQ